MDMSHAAIVKRAREMKTPEPTFDFGRHNGQTVKHVLAHAPGYIVWCWENFNNRARLPFGKDVYLEACDLCDEDEYDIMDDPMEHWARELAGE